MSKNAEGWIRHRGGKCPVGEGVKVDYRMRDGDVDDFGRDAVRLKWNHIGGCADIMAYRLHKPAEQVAPDIYAADDSEQLGGVDISFIEPAIAQGPLQWRDRIAEIDVEVQARTVERAELVQKLASEGFALIGRVVEPVEDMSDWRNWKVGDEVVAGCGCGGFSFHGEVVKIIEIAKNGSMKVARLREPDYGWLFTTSEVESDLSFHSRPSA